MQEKRESRRRLNQVMVLIGIMTAFTAPVALAEHQFTVPEEVQADQNGHFSYEMVLVIGPEGALLGPAFVTNVLNTDVPTTWYDGFCDPVAPGTVITVPIEGSLIDITQDGAVYEESALCDGPAWQVTTSVLRAINPVGDAMVPVADRLHLSVHPSPVATQATFEFELPDAGSTRLTIHDVAGRQVATVLDGSVDPGSRTVAWDIAASGLTSGVYFARLEHRGQVLATRRVVVSW